MTVQKKDFTFLFVAILLSGIAAIVLGTSDENIEIYGIAGLLGIVLVLAIIVKPNFGANVLIIAIFSNVSAQLTDHGYPGIIKPLVVVVFCAIMVRNYYAGQIPTDRRSTAVIEMFLIMYFIVLAASYLVASNKDRAMSEVVDFGKDLVILYTIIFSLREWKTWKQAVWILIFTTAILSLLGVYQIATGNHSQEFFRFSTVEVQGVFDNDNSSTARIGGPVHDPNMWAQILVAVISLAIFRVIHEQQLKWKMLGVGILISMLIVLLDTYSRGGYLALIVVLAMIFLVFERRRFNPTSAIISFALLVFLIPLLPSSYVARFESLFLLTSSSESSAGIYEDGSLQGRTSVMQTAVVMFSQNPLLGVGAGNFRNNYQKYNQLLGIEFEYGEREAHSLYAQIISETGILGAIAFLGIIFSLLSGLGRSVRSIKHLPAFKSYVPWIASLQVAIIGYLVAATFLHNDYIRYFWIFVAVSMTAIQIIDEQVKVVDHFKPSEKSL